MADKPILAVDVSKGWLDACSTAAATIERIANDDATIGAFLDRVRPALVAFEPTGGYEQALIDALRARGIPFIRVHPNAVIAYRKSRGIKAKTDPIDARLILDFVVDRLRRPDGGAPSIAANEPLRALAARRRQLADTLHAERCRLALARLPGVRTSLERVIAVLQDSLAALDRELAAAIAADPDSAALAALLRSICGIGPAVAASLIAELPELGLLSAKQIAALVGLAPNTRRSGKIRYREPTGHGRADVRRALFNAARAAIRHPSPFRDFYDRLVTQNHRPGKVALTAVMRKILITANAVARDRQPWRGQPTALGASRRAHAEPTARRADRVKAKAARRAVARSASLDAV
jgi:transposase